MKKSLLIAFTMACVLFVYGWLASSMGHDHSAHNGSERIHSEEEHHH